MARGCLGKSHQDGLIRAPALVCVRAGNGPHQGRVCDSHGCGRTGWSDYTLHTREPQQLQLRHGLAGTKAGKAVWQLGSRQRYAQKSSADGGQEGGAAHSCDLPDHEEGARSDSEC